MTRRFELIDRGSSKFWELDVSGKKMTIRFGRIDAAGQTKVKSFGSPAEAQKAAARLVAEKTGKGYLETSASKGVALGAEPPKAKAPRPLARVVGALHWTSGPLVVTARDVHERWTQDFGKRESSPLNRMKKTVVIAKLEGKAAVVLPRQAQTMVFPWSGAVILASVTAKQLGDIRKALTLAPVGEAQRWKPVGTVRFGDEVVFFDAWSMDPSGARHERKARVQLPLAPGKYLVEIADGIARRVPLFPNKAVDVKYRLVRLRPPTWAGVAKTTTTTTARTSRPLPEVVTASGPLLATREVIRAAKKLRSVGGTEDGGPVVMPAKLVKSWFGIFDANGAVSKQSHSAKVFARSVRGGQWVEFRGSSRSVNSPARLCSAEEALHFLSPPRDTDERRQSADVGCEPTFRRRELGVTARGSDPKTRSISDLSARHGGCFDAPP